MIESKVAKYISIVLGLFILVPFKLKPLLVVLLFVFSLFVFFKKKEYSNKTIFINFTIVSLVLIPYLLSFIYSNNLSRAVEYLIRSIPLLIIPLSFYFISGSLKSSMINVFIKTFIISNVIYVFLMTIYIINLGYLTVSNDLYFYYSYITYGFYGIGDHPIYISVQLSLSILFLIKTNFNKFVKVLFYIILFFGLFLLSRKGVVLSLFVVLFIYLSQILIKKRTIFLLLGLVILGFLSSLLIPQIKMRYDELFEKTKYVDNDKSSTGIRIILWKNAVELIQKSPFFGYSIGDAQDVLSQKLRENNYIEIADKKSNCHNQYLQFLLSVGVFGLFFFLFTVVYYLKQFKKNKNTLGYIVLIFFLLIFLTESFLDRQNGIIIFSLFITILVSFNNINLKIEKHKSLT